jgi:hypothetical protein
MEQDGFVELVSPVAPAPELGERWAERRVTAPWRGFDGARVSIVDNGKTNASELLEGLRELLVGRHGAVLGIIVRKEVSGPIRDDDLAALVTESDLVLVGSAD